MPQNTVETVQTNPPVHSPETGFGLLKRELLRRPLTVTGLVIVTLIIAIAILAPWLAPYDPYAINLDARLQAPSSLHWAGTDEVGRDLFARILYGARISISIGLGIVLISGTLGTLIGCFAGFMGGKTDALVMRLMDLLMALPGLVVALALTAALGPSLVNAMFALSVLAIPVYSRVARGQTLSIRERNYVKASQTMGAGAFHVIWHHIIPNIVSPILVFATLHIGGAILASTALSFIGLGAQPPLAEWGALINAGRPYILGEWWYSFIPGVIIVITVLGFNLLGDGLRDILDPKEKAK